jgi:hypothetical protein
MTDKERRNALLMLLGGGAGGASALSLTKLRAIEDPVTRRFHASHPVVLAGTMSPELGGGSGEAQAGYRLMKLLRNNGIPAVIAPTRIPQLDRNMAWGDAGSIDGSNLADLNKYKYMPQNRVTRQGADTRIFKNRPMGDVLIDKLLKASGSKGVEHLRRIQALPPGGQRAMYDLLLSTKGSKVFTEPEMQAFNEALATLHSGKWNNWSVGRLYTALKVGGLDAIKHPEYWMHPDSLVEGLTTGNIASVLPLERGFKWGTIGVKQDLMDSLRTTDAVLNQKFAPHAWAQMNEYKPYAGETVNLGIPTNLKINWDSPTDAMLPGITAAKPPATPEEARRLFTESRKDLIDAIHEIRAERTPLNLAGKNLVFMSAGSAGPNTTSKLLNAIEALDSTNKDYHILLQSGTTLSPDLEETVNRLKTTHPGKVTWTPYIGSVPGMTGSQRLARYANGADLYLTYGGSSTAAESGALTTPMVFTSDWDTNLKNSKYIVGRRGDDLIANMDNRVLALDRMSRKLEAAPDRLRTLGIQGLTRDRWTNEDWKKVLEELKAETKVDFGDIADKRTLFEDMVSGKALRDNRERNSNLIKRMLTDEVKARRFSPEHLRTVGNYHKGLEDATTNFIAAVRKHHAKAKNAIGFSGTGIKGFLGRAGRLFTKNPAMAKIAPLAAIGGAAGGVGLTKYLVDKYDSRNKGISGRINDFIKRHF